jgi:membrane protein required for colicin V production
MNVMPFQPYDAIMLLVLGGCVAWGAWKGFAWQLASLASIFLSYFVALNFRNQLAQAIQLQPPLNIFAAMLALFLGCSLVVWLAFNFVSELIERVKLKEFDRQVGAVFGFLKGAVLCVIVTLFGVTLLDQRSQQQICSSRSGYYIAVLLDRLDALMPREIHQVLAPYIQEFEQKEQQYGPGWTDQRPGYDGYNGGGYGANPPAYDPRSGQGGGYEYGPAYPSGYDPSRDYPPQDYSPRTAQPYSDSYRR